jgi:hypothetical protein
MKNSPRLIIATDKKLFFSDGCHPSGRSFEPVELPLAQFLSGDVDDRCLSAFQETRSKVLLIVPDHWLQHEFFLFKSQRDSLIKPFLERKLKATYPSLPQVHNFFTYACRQKAVEGPGVRVFHLHERNSYDLYEALCDRKLTPRWITTPALLWEERFRRLAPEFATQAALFVHLHPNEAFLYFYHQGDFLFSRTVALPDAAERWDALLFEVNQSIYLFSQKARSDLNQIYLAGSAAGFQERLSDILGRPVSTIPLAEASPALPGELAFLEGLLARTGTSAPDGGHSLTHRRIQHDQKWRPVQWVGLLSAAMVLLFFMGEHQWLEGRLLEEITARSRMRQQQPMTLADYEVALLELAADAKRPPTAHTVLAMVSSLPEDVLIHEIKMDPDARRLDLAATVTAGSIDRFRHLLKGLIENLNRRLDPSPPLTVEDMAVNMEETKNPAARTQYKIACRVPLP